MRARPMGRAEREPMILTVVLVLALAAFVLAIAAGMQKAPLWIAVLVLAVLELIKAVPVIR
jgi:hypothetical protein